MVLLAPPFHSTWCRMAQGRCFSSGTLCLLLYVEAGKGSLRCPCTKTSLSSICSGPVVSSEQTVWYWHTEISNWGIFYKGLWGGYPVLHLFFFSSSGPLLPLPHPELKFVSLLNYFKKCTACPPRHRKLHLMVYCIRISIFRQKSTDTISDFLSPILLIFASSCTAWFGCCHGVGRARCHQLEDGFITS